MNPDLAHRGASLRTLEGRPGQRGRWPVRTSYPPGGGCGFLARTTSPPAFEGAHTWSPA